MQQCCNIVALACQRQHRVRLDKLEIEFKMESLSRQILVSDLLPGAVLQQARCTFFEAVLQRHGATWIPGLTMQYHMALTSYRRQRLKTAGRWLLYGYATSSTKNRAHHLAQDATKTRAGPTAARPSGFKRLQVAARCIRPSSKTKPSCKSHGIWSNSMPPSPTLNSQPNPDTYVVTLLRADACPMTNP